MASAESRPLPPTVEVTYSMFATTVSAVRAYHPRWAGWDWVLSLLCTLMDLTLLFTWTSTLRSKARENSEQLQVKTGGHPEIFSKEFPSLLFLP